MFILLLDKLLNSECGFICGFTVSTNKFSGIIDIILNYFSKNILLIDFYILLILIIYIFICFLYGVLQLGIRFMIIELYSIKPKCSSSQALLFLSYLLNIFTLSSMNVMNFICNKILLEDSGFINIKEISNLIPYNNIIKILSSFIFCLIFVYAMSTSYANTNSGNNIDIDILEEDDEKMMLNMA